MSGWLWLALAIILIAAILSIRLRVSVFYDEEGFRAAALFGRITVFRYPRRTGDEAIPKKKKPREPEAEKEEVKEQQKKGGKLPPLRELLSIIGDTLGKLRRKLRVDELTLWYCSAAQDPFAAAMAFGGASAAAELLLAPLERAFRIKKRDIRTAVSFTETEPTVVLTLSLSLSLFALFGILLYAGLRYLRSMRKMKKLSGHPTDGHRFNSTEG